MAQTHIPYHKPSHRPLTTAHLAQTMTLLEMNNEELLEKVEGELASNPALEILEEIRCPNCNRVTKGGLCPVCAFPSTIGYDSPVVFVSTRYENYIPSRYSQEESSFEDYSPEVEDLGTYVYSQIGSEIKEEDKPIVAHILASLDDDGLLAIPITEISLYHHVPISRIEEILSKIQHCDPMGVGSKNSQEALLVQLEVLGETQDINPLVYKAIEEGYDELKRQQFRNLGKLLGVSTQKAEMISEFIKENLNPFPARAFWGSPRHLTNSAPSRYHKPDAIISCHGDKGNPQLIIEILWPIYGTLRINPAFQKALNNAPQEKSKQWNSDFQKANLLIKCLGQRNHTLVKLMELLAEKQRKFILEGDQNLIPITRATLAEELGVHESTISRAVSGKSVQLPTGQIIPIAKFFDRSLHIRTALKDIIANEEKPLSDEKLSEILIEQGYNIARRTVAKYRSMEGILPAHQRKKNKSNEIKFKDY